MRLSDEGQHRKQLLVVAVVVCALASIAATSLAEPAAVSFRSDVLPVLSDRCFICHGPDGNTRESGLRLDVRHEALSQADSGEVAIAPGDPDASELVRRILSQEEGEVMPPPDSGKSLSPEEIDLLKRWIAQGAKYDQHWAYSPIQRPEVPAVGAKDPVNNPIDSFIINRLSQSGLGLAPKARPEKLIRRMYFDLTGLPPTLEEVDAVLADSRASRFSNLADRLIASPHYGERMAISWLDGARYADSNGYQNDFARQMWPYRDWVIKAYNSHMPFDQFTVEQLAGDLLPNPSLDQVVATGFNRNNRTVTEAGSLPEEWLVENVVDRVEATSAVFLGLTMGCSRCHDHKYDPVSQEEFFEFFAFFNNITEEGVYEEQRGNVPPMRSVPSEGDRTRLAELNLERERLVKKRDSLAADSNLQVVDPAKQLAEQPVPTPAIRISGDHRAVARTANGDEVSAIALGNVGYAESPLGGSIVVANGGVEYPGLIELRNDRPFSVSLWVKIKTSGALFSVMDTDADFRGADLLVLDDHRLSVHLLHEWPHNGVKVVTKKQLPLGQWTHVAATYDGSSKAAGMQIFVDGRIAKLDVEHDTLTRTVSTEQPLRIGQRKRDALLSGEIADVQVFASAVSANEVASILASKLLELNRQRSYGPVAEGGSSESLDELRSRLVAFGANSALNQIDNQLSAVANQRSALERSVPTVMVMEERAERRPTYVLVRGEYHSPDKSRPVNPGVPEFLHPLPEGKADRLSLAKWIVSPDNPLTARVVVNRQWAHFFGQGLVESTENFGVQSKPPSHPKLLDWLASELIDSGWDIQHIQRLIVDSATYQQSSRISDEKLQADPNNKLLSRGPRVRLPAELIRDNALAISGLLAPKVGGPSVMPYQPGNLWEELAGGAREVYTQATNSDLYRRSLYTYRKRTVPHPTLTTFDAPSWEICTVRRGRTNTPLQALALLNDVTYVEAARKLAERVTSSELETPAERIALAFRLATSRFPSDAEADRLGSAFADYLQFYNENTKLAEALLSNGHSESQSVVAAPTLAAYTAVASVLLNLDETITKD